MEWLETYKATSDPNERYQLLRQEAKRLRGAGADTRFDRNEELLEILRRQNTELDGTLLAFLANDFGIPPAYLPDGHDREALNDVRVTILEDKYNSNRSDLNPIREELHEVDNRIHQVLVVEWWPDRVGYFLPEGKSGKPDFLTVREPLGLVDWTANRPEQGWRVRY